MKRILFCLISLMLCISLISCTHSFPGDVLARTDEREITSYHTDDGDTKIHYISDPHVINNLCNTFSLMKLKRVKIAEPLEFSYSVRFLDERGGATLMQVTVISGRNTINLDGKLYNIIDEMNINRHLEDLLDNINAWH